MDIGYEHTENVVEIVFILEDISNLEKRRSHTLTHARDLLSVLKYLIVVSDFDNRYSLRKYSICDRDSTLHI